MKTLSGLRDSVRAYVGCPLLFRLEHGWGWTIHRDDSAAELFNDADGVNLTTVQLVPSEFLSYGGASTRGFLGRVSQPRHALHDLPVLALTLSDGFDYDFTSNTCQAWRLIFGDGELVCPPEWFPYLRGARVIGGYGRHLTAEDALATQSQDSDQAVHGGPAGV